MGKVNLKITLTLQGPVLTQSSTPGEYGIDAPMARNSAEKPYLPGTLVLGRLRQSLEELSEATSEAFISKTEIHELFGVGTGSLDNRGGVEASRKRIGVTDFVSISAGGKDTLYRIRMDSERGAVEPGAYLVIDSPFAPGARVSLSGTISYFLPDGEEDVVKNKIETGLRWTTSFGAERTIGFGRLLDVNVVQEQVAHSAKGELDGKGAHFRLIIRPIEPFCIARRQVDRNLFESEEIIPGGAIKGGLAYTWGMLVKGKGPNETIDGAFDLSRRELAENFSKIRFSHAFPADKIKKKRPTIFPLSLIKYMEQGAGNGKEKMILTDAARMDGATVLGNPPAAPAFCTDWKRTGDVTKRFGWPELARELRVRTAMDRASRTSKDKQLFAYELIVPDGHEWVATIDLSRVHKDRDKVLSQLSDLLGNGLNGWGKTKCHAEVEITGMETEHIEEPSDGLYVVTMQTPAVLCDPSVLNEASGSDELFKEYVAVWKELSGSSLELIRFFARQSLAGGYYLHNRFQPDKDYYPWLLTEPGSVFVLKKTGQEAHNKIVDWQKHGLNFPQWAVERYWRGDLAGSDWWCCPYIPENGYGELAVNIKLDDFPKAEVL